MVARKEFWDERSSVRSALSGGIMTMTGGREMNIRRKFGQVATRKFHPPRAIAWLLAISSIAFAAATFASPAGGFKLEAADIQPGADIPQKFTCSGEDVSPALKWSGAPAGTKTFALIVEDPDAPGGTFIHWVVYNLPGDARELKEGTNARSVKIDGRSTEGGGALQGPNDFQEMGYKGPCPPPGKPHRYYFRLYALDTALGINGQATQKAVEKAMKGHILAKAELMGKFGR
jgi:Raf kinase inhibitor-like YbhB/YbcL family protein